MRLNKKFILNWIAPIMIALVVFVFVKPTMAQIMTPDELSRYVLENDVIVGEETVEGFRQVYYMLNEEKIFVTSGRDNSRNPAVNKEYMVWVTEVNGGGGQIFLYHIPTGITTAITGSGTNLNPRVSDSGAVVWEKWLDEKWQIFMYDGISVRQLTDGDVSVNADVSGDQVVFVRQDEEKNWRTVKLDLSVRRAEVIAEGVKHKTPSFFEGNVVYDFGAEIKSERAKEKAMEQRILERMQREEEWLRQEEEKKMRAEEARLLAEQKELEQIEQDLIDEILLEESPLDSALQLLGNALDNIIDILTPESPVLPAEEIATSSTSTPALPVESIIIEEIPVTNESEIIPDNIVVETPVETEIVEEVIETVSTENAIVGEADVIAEDQAPIETTPVEQVLTEEIAEEAVEETTSEPAVDNNAEYFAEVGAPETVTEEDIMEELAETPVIIEEIIPEPATETAETAEAVITETVSE